MILWLLILLTSVKMPPQKTQCQYLIIIIIIFFFTFNHCFRRLLLEGKVGEALLMALRYLSLRNFYQKIVFLRLNETSLIARVLQDTPSQVNYENTLLCHYLDVCDFLCASVWFSVSFQAQLVYVILSSIFH